MNDEKKYVEKIILVPYVCTVPRGGLRAIRCFPDAVVFLCNGHKLGYSPKERGLLIPHECPIKPTLLKLIESKLFEFKPELLESFGIKDGEEKKDC